MNNLAKLLCALVLGLAAAGLNVYWASQQNPTEKIVVIKAALKEGQVIKADHLAFMQIPADGSDSAKTWIRHQDRSLLVGMKSPRAYAAGDIVLQRDITAPVKLPEWSVLGPFRLISVGEQFTNDGEGYSGSGRGNSVTVAVPEDPTKYDDDTKRLIQIIDPGRATSKKGVSKEHLLRIVAVQVYATGGADFEADRGDTESMEGTSEVVEGDMEAGTEESGEEIEEGSDEWEEFDEGFIMDTELDLRQGEAALIVPLQNVANVPRVMLAGSRVGFVIPAFGPQ